MREHGRRETGFAARIVAKIVKMMLFVVLGCLLFGYVVMVLWNWLMPMLFGLRAVTFWQALGLLVLSKLLLGGFHKHVGGRGSWKRGWGDRWAKMSPEERERFRAGMREGRGCWGGRDFTGSHAEATAQERAKEAREGI